MTNTERTARRMWCCSHCEAWNDETAEHCWKCTDAADAQVAQRLARAQSIVDSLHKV